MKKINAALTVLMLSAAVLTGCSKSQETLAPEERETQALWGLTIYESNAETPADGETEVQTESSAAVEKLDNGVNLMAQDDTELRAVSAVNVRSGPGTDFDKLGKAGEGETVIMTGICDNGWIRIDFEGEAGYVSMDFVESEDESVSLSALLEQVKAAGEAAASESSTGESSEEPDEENGQDESSRSESSGDESSGDESSKAESSGESAEESGAGDISGEGELAWATTDVNVRKGPKASYEVIGQLKQGQSIKVLDSSDAWWWKVEFNGQEAYISVQYLTTEKPE